jgi:hypothetical protein
MRWQPALAFNTKGEPKVEKCHFGSFRRSPLALAVRYFIQATHSAVGVLKPSKVMSGRVFLPSSFYLLASMRRVPHLEDFIIMPDIFLSLRLWA